MRWASGGVGFESAPPPVGWRTAGVEFKARVWREVLHPRDWRGRFTDKPGGDGPGRKVPLPPSGTGKPTKPPKRVGAVKANYTAHATQILESFGWHKPGSGQPKVVQDAAHRVLNKQPLTAHEAEQLADALRAEGDAPDSTPKRRSSLRTSAARLDAAAARIHGIADHLVPAGGQRIAPKDIKVGDRVAIPGRGGTVDVRTVTSTGVNNGLTELLLDDGSGIPERRFLMRDTDVFRVPVDSGGASAAAALPVHPAKAADMKLGPGDKPAALYDGYGPGVGPGAVGPGQHWYDVLAAAGYSSKPIPVTGLTVEGHTITDGLAFRKADVSYLIEKKPGESDDDALARAQKGVEVLQGVLFTVPADKRKLQRGLAMLEANNPADAFWAKKYDMEGFTSRATGGFGGTVIWGGNEVLPTTLAHEFGHTFDSSLHGTNTWLSDANGPVVPGQQISWKQARVYDEDISKVFAGDYVETRKGGRPVKLGALGVTGYGEKAVREDFAESVRLWMKDKREGRIGYLKSTGENVRFSDLFPERAKILDAAFGVNPEHDTKIRLRLRKEAEDKFFESFKAKDADPLTFPLTPNTLLNSGLPLDERKAAEVAAKERFAQWKKAEEAKKAAAEAAKKLAAEQAAAKAKAAAEVASIKAALQAGRLPKTDAAKLRQRVWRYKKKLREQGYSEADIAKLAAAFETAQLHAFLGLDEGFGEPWNSAKVSPDFNEAERAAAHAWLLKAGKTVHPFAEPQYDIAPQAKANIAAELASRVMDNPEFLERYKQYKVNTGLASPAYFENVSDDLLRSDIENEISSRVSTWAGTSGDSDKRAVLMQQAVKVEFGLSAHPAPTLPEKDFDGFMASWGTHGDWYRAVARVMYEHTQEEFKKSGITHISVYRGMHFAPGKAPAWAKSGPPRKVKLQPINSWSTNYDTSELFAGSWVGGNHRIMMKARVPVELVLGSALTGFGCLNEYEFVVFDSEGLVDVTVL